MSIRFRLTAALVIALLATSVSSQTRPPAACAASSGERTTALVELYTSEGCDSCPPADRWLSSIASTGFGPDRVVPMALHVDYWDYLGWKDPWAKREHTRRQQLLAKTRRSAIVYTPQVLLQGKEFRQWGTPEFERVVASINAIPARARMTLRVLPPTGGSLAVELNAEVLDPAMRGHAAAYVATYENKLVSEVKAGENRGRTLAHDYVVLEWQGPIGFDTAARLSERRMLALLPGAKLAHSGVVAFVQDRRTSEVLQAVMRPVCSA